MRMSSPVRNYWKALERHLYSKGVLISSIGCSGHQPGVQKEVPRSLLTGQHLRNPTQLPSYGCRHSQSLYVRHMVGIEHKGVPPSTSQQHAGIKALCWALSIAYGMGLYHHWETHHEVHWDWEHKTLRKNGGAILCWLIWLFSSSEMTPLLGIPGSCCKCDPRPAQLAALSITFWQLQQVQQLLSLSLWVCITRLFTSLILMENIFPEHWHNSDPKCHLPAGLRSLHAIAGGTQRQLVKPGPCSEGLDIPSDPVSWDASGCSIPSHGIRQWEAGSADSSTTCGLGSMREWKFMLLMSIIFPALTASSCPRCWSFTS